MLVHIDVPSMHQTMVGALLVLAIVNNEHADTASVMDRAAIAMPPAMSLIRRTAAGDTDVMVRHEI